MVEENKPDRAERRRQEKEAAKGKVKAICQECKEGPCDIAPKTFDKCPVCGCPTSFTVQAMKGDIHLQDLEGREPALFSFEKIYDTPNYKLKLVAVGASCARCGVFYTLARDKMKGVPFVLPGRGRGGDGGPRIIRPGQGG